MATASARGMAGSSVMTSPATMMSDMWIQP
jgi:hypothetical protein